MSIDHLETPYVRQIALWILRIFSPELAGHLFLRKGSYADNDIACYLGLPLELDDETPASLPSLMADMRHQLEASGDANLPGLAMDNFEQFGTVLGLNPTENAILGFYAVSDVEPALRDSLRVARSYLTCKTSRFLTGVLGLSLESVTSALEPGSTLLRSGVLKWTSRHSCKEPQLQFFSDDLASSLLKETYNSTRILAIMGVNKSPGPALALADYPHLVTDLTLLLPYLKHAMATGKPGVNILLYGAPGTGKTQLTRAIARDVGFPLYEFATCDRDGDPMGADGRLGAVRIAGKFFDHSPALFAFDEAEDILTPSIRGVGLVNNRKGWFNNLLETNRHPIFWLANSIEHLDPAFTRRFDFVIEVPIPPRAQRTRLLKDQVGELLSDKMIELLAQSEHLAPAVISRSASVFSAVADSLPQGTRDEAFVRMVGSVLKAQGHGDALEQACDCLPLDVYDVSRINTDANLAGIAATLKHNPDARICLHGPPGTGKTAFGHWLAREMDRPLQIERASDLLSPLVGGTEQQIAKVFDKALRDHSILMIDEVDSFLMDRSKAQRSWEVTQVNEMLTRIETFHGVLIASTNRLEHLDPASLRRFDLKLRFGYLLPAQACELLVAWCRSLAIAPPEPQHLVMIEAIGNATPGDFAAAARRHRFHPFADAGALASALVAECEMKGEQCRPIGFHLT